MWNGMVLAEKRGDEQKKGTWNDGHVVGESEEQPKTFSKTYDVALSGTTLAFTTNLSG